MSNDQPTAAIVGNAIVLAALVEACEVALKNLSPKGNVKKDFSGHVAMAALSKAVALAKPASTDTEAVLLETLQGGMAGISKEALDGIAEALKRAKAIATGWGMNNKDMLAGIETAASEIEVELAALDPMGFPREDFLKAADQTDLI